MDLFGGVYRQDVGWSAKPSAGYECSTKGDKRFSALCALMPDGRTIEMHYQCDIKGYDPGGTDWRTGKGRAGLIDCFSQGKLWSKYLALWEVWAQHHPQELEELRALAHQHNSTLTDRFATSPINQAHALSVILNRTK